MNFLRLPSLGWAVALLGAGLTGTAYAESAQYPRSADRSQAVFERIEQRALAQAATSLTPPRPHIPHGNSNPISFQDVRPPLSIGREASSSAPSKGTPQGGSMAGARGEVRALEPARAVGRGRVRAAERARAAHLPEKGKSSPSCRITPLPF